MVGKWPEFESVAVVRLTAKIREGEMSFCVEEREFYNKIRGIIKP